MQSEATNREVTIDQLNSFLRGELAAVETYRLALARLDGSAHRSTLVQCSRSHEERARMLTEAVRGRGGHPEQTSGAWGTLARLVEKGATALGENAAVAALEEGEDHGRDDYMRDLQKLDANARQLVEFVILPEQRRTHNAISAVKKSIS